MVVDADTIVRRSVAKAVTLNGEHDGLSGTHELLHLGEPLGLERRRSKQQHDVGVLRQRLLLVKGVGADAVHLVVTHLAQHLFGFLKVVLFLGAERLTKLGVEFCHLAVLFALLDRRKQHDLGLALTRQPLNSAEQLVLELRQRLRHDRRERLRALILVGDLKGRVD